MYGPRDAICCLANTPRSMFVCVSLRTMTISPGSNVRGNRDLFFRARIGYIASLCMIAGCPSNNWLVGGRSSNARSIGNGNTRPLATKERMRSVPATGMEFQPYIANMTPR
eukprot:scaffold41674_cov56-Attheya_sp.AAC.2